MEARRTEFEQKLAVTEEKRAAKVHAQPLPVPDFKALHIAQEASLACRKEQIVPILPAGQIEFSTEQRAKERERFDEMMKRKEEEMERLREERRKQQEIELEREIKELRKKAVPKAHEVPEWYGDMPKRKGGGVKG
ncbi:hypothetical protein SERLADRAFT_402995 [Serpula lacrymans var. lacrymans S7.9]|nr:uncharacterized protein SERLADRAFT_402995 [Serpula lacrymans var. lacrymans S7.9]EGO18916.1 hypothetical protein SERLADRAFT_402995 [Serpula lacrymans var. lacrymans S7.9]